MSALSRAVGLTLLAIVTPVLRAADAESRPPAEHCVPPGEIPPREAFLPEAGTPVNIDAGSSDTGTAGPLRFDDGVTLTRANQTLETETLIYDPDTGRVQVPDWLHYADGVITLDAAGGTYFIKEERGRFDQVSYHIAGAQASGHAASAELTAGRETFLTAFDFTTCDPDDPAWQLKASRVTLDHERGVGVARNARLELGGVPLLWSPWFRFPLDDRRQTGFLFPTLGTSSGNGLDLTVPWYWNIAPNMDATLSPRLIADRGGLLGSELRFLSRRQRGTLYGAYLPGDDRYDDDRWRAEIDYRARLSDNWSAGLDLARISDPDYFADLGEGLEQAAIQYLRSSGHIAGHGRFWSFEAMADTFQVLDESVSPTNEPYRRLPRMQFDGDWPLGAGFDLSLDSEVVYFDRDAGVTGARADIMPALSWSWLTPGAFLRPSLAFRGTAYQLDDAPGEASPTRTLPIASVDTGLVFERTTGGGNIQTLEPRLYYLYVPYRDQSGLPRFDTSELTFGFGQLFHTNRFSGPDRQADANRLTLALTSRLIDPATGASRFRISLGQIRYFGGRRVGLGDTAPPERDGSALVGEVSWSPVKAIALDAGLQWDPADSETEVAALGLRYSGDGGRRLALGYRFREERVDQADLRLRWPLSGSLTAIARLNYSFLDDRTLEVLGGLEYESCCWAVSLTGRRWIAERNAETRTGVFVELHLKGLGSLGRRPYELF